MNIKFPAKLEPQETSGYVVQFIDLEEVFTEGETIEECLFNGTEVLTGMLELYMEQGKNIPRPSENVENVYYIAPEVKVQSALLIKWARGDKPLADIARALDTSWPAAQRLEDPTHWATLRQLDKAAAALGKKLVLSLE